MQTTAPTATPMSAPTTTQAAPPTVTPTGAATGVTAAPGATTVPGVTNANNALVLKFNQDCWVEVRRVNGNVLLSRLIKAGETETVPMTDPVQLVIGNVAGVEASLRGAPLVLKNGPGNTARLTVK
jgi:cytoskeleton protein RodZ